MNVSSTALVALSQAAERVDRAAEGISRATHPARSLEDQLDLSAEAVRLLVAKNGYAAAIELARTAHKVNKQAIDLLA